MALNFEELRDFAAKHEAQVRQSLPSPATNPPTWDTFRAEGGVFSVVLNEPVDDKGNPYALVGAGAEYAIVGDDTLPRPVFFYQVQLASDTAFTSSLSTHDLGSSRIADIKLPSVSRYARARARIINSEWSEWTPAVSLAVSGPAFTSAHTSYRPKSNPLTATDAGATATISIASFNMAISGLSDVSVNSGSITALSFDTLHYVYYDDPNFQGGAVSFSQTTTKETALGNLGRFFVGSIRTPKDSGSDTVGNNDGGVGAQAGRAVVFGAGTNDYSTTGSGASWTSQINGRDLDNTTFAVGTATGNSTNKGATVTFRQFPGSFEPWKSLKLKIKTEVPTNTLDGGVGVATLRYSTDDGGSWTVIFSLNFGVTRALTVDSINLLLSLNTALVRVEALVRAQIADTVGTVTHNFYEAWIEGEV